MNYNKIVQGILDIGESMLISGAENYRIEDSLSVFHWRPESGIHYLAGS